MVDPGRAELPASFCAAAAGTVSNGNSRSGRKMPCMGWHRLSPCLRAAAKLSCFSAGASTQQRAPLALFCFLPLPPAISIHLFPVPPPTSLDISARRQETATPDPPIGPSSSRSKLVLCCSPVLSAPQNHPAGGICALATESPKLPLSCSLAIRPYIHIENIM